MLKYKNVEFLQIFAKKCALLFTFVKFLLYFCTFLHHFFLAPFAQTTHAANQYLFIDQKQTPPREEPKKA
jgi:hypothetical protein